MKKTFRAHDGRKVQMSEEQIAEQELLNMVTVIMPILALFLFSLAAGVIV